jgi:hypothetical protein
MGKNENLEAATNQKDDEGWSGGIKNLIPNTINKIMSQFK